MILKNSYSTRSPFIEISLSILPQEVIKSYPEKLNHLGEHVRKRRLELWLTQREVGGAFWGFRGDSLQLGK